MFYLRGSYQNPLPQRGELMKEKADSVQKSEVLRPDLLSSSGV